MATGVGIVAGILFFIFLMRQSNRREIEEGKTVNQNARQYMGRFSIAIVGYVLFLLGSVMLLGRIDSQPLQIIIAILPMIPVSYGMWAYMQWVHNLDELQQRIQLEAIAFSLGMTGIITFTIGFLEGVGIPQIGLIWVFPMIIMFWGVGQFIAMRRYE